MHCVRIVLCIVRVCEACWSTLDSFTHCSMTVRKKGLAALSTRELIGKVVCDSPNRDSSSSATKNSFFAPFSRGQAGQFKGCALVCGVVTVAVATVVGEDVDVVVLVEEAEDEEEEEALVAVVAEEAEEAEDEARRTELAGAEEEIVTAASEELAVAVAVVARVVIGEATCTILIGGARRVAAAERAPLRMLVASMGEIGAEGK